jgi:hypothetical protein
MCPFCMASIGMIVAGATSAGGLTALAVKLSRKKKLGQEVTPNSSESSSQVNRLMPGPKA